MMDLIPANLAHQQLSALPNILALCRRRPRLKRSPRDGCIVRLSLCAVTIRKLLDNRAASEPQTSFRPGANRKRVGNGLFKSFTHVEECRELNDGVVEDVVDSFRVDLQMEDLRGSGDEGGESGEELLIVGA
jgi:hypothetical protein